MPSRNTDPLSGWLRQNGRTSLCIVSPHLDDAVYSAFAALTDPGVGQCEVVTVVTSALPGTRTHWSTISGFPDSCAEHAERCREDQQVLGSLRVKSTHLGGITTDAENLRACLEQFVVERAGGMRDCAFLLPGGAGRQSGFAERVWRRLRRDFDPLGSHPEHVLVRNIMTSALRRQPGALWGYYAELPYIRNDSVPALCRRLAHRARSRLLPVKFQPEAELKLVAAAGYRSQADLQLGREQDSRLGFCSHPEWLFLQAGL